MLFKPKNRFEVINQNEKKLEKLSSVRILHSKINLKKKCNGEPNN